MLQVEYGVCSCFGNHLCSHHRYKHPVDKSMYVISIEWSLLSSGSTLGGWKKSTFVVFAEFLGHIGFVWPSIQQGYQTGFLPAGFNGILAGWFPTWDAYPHLSLASDGTVGRVCGCSFFKAAT